MNKISNTKQYWIENLFGKSTFEEIRDFPLDYIKQKIENYEFVSYSSFISCLNYVTSLNDETKRYYSDIDKDDYWFNQIKRKPKFISNKDFFRLIKKIENQDDYPEFIIGLIWCAYEGIFNEDYTVYRDMTINDLHEDSISVVLDDIDYTISVSSDLIKHLRSLACMTQVISGIKRRKYNLIGFNYSSVFKIQDTGRAEMTNDKWHMMMTKRLSRSISAYSNVVFLKRFYVSGILYKIKLAFDELGLSYKEGMLNLENKSVQRIIRKILSDCGFQGDYFKFISYIKGCECLFDDENI